MPVHASVRRRPRAPLPPALRAIAVADRQARVARQPLPPRGGSYVLDSRTGSLTRTDRDLPAIVLAIGTLDATDATLFTGGGKPTVAAIAGVLGYSVSGADRDAAWAQIRGA